MVLNSLLDRAFTTLRYASLEDLFLYAQPLAHLVSLSNRSIA